MQGVDNITHRRTLDTQHGYAVVVSNNLHGGVNKFICAYKSKQSSYEQVISVHVAEQIGETFFELF